MSNLAHKPDYIGELVDFPTRERQSMSKKEEGFTPLPNFICDEGYLAVLSGEAIKCLILLNRHIKGFHDEKKSLGEALVMKLTGFKDKRTVRKNMAELAKYGLISITKNLGKATEYSVTFECRIKPELVTSNGTGALNVGTSNDTGVVTSDVPSTSDIKCHSVKEIYLKENIKTNIQECVGENSVESVLNLWTPDLHSLNSWLQRSGEKPMTQDQVNLTLLEVNSHYEPRLKVGLITDTQMYSNFVKWIKRNFTPKNQTGYFQKQPLQKTRWEEIQELKAEEGNGHDSYGF